MNVRQIACKRLLEEELIPEIKEEWEKLYHNGSYGAYWPDVEDDEWEHFYGSLEGYVRCEIDYIEDWIEEEHDFEWEIYQYGRSGATFYPKINDSCNGYSRNLDMDKVVCLEDIEGEQAWCDDEGFENTFTGWSDGYKEAARFLAAIKLLNKHARGTAKYIPDWWVEERAHLVEEGIIEEESDEEVQEC